MAVPPPKLGEFPPGTIDKSSVPHHQRHWVPDQRDAFIGWLRGEFAAANAIIDSLCQHLHLIGAPGEYDFVLGSIQQRRFSWNGVLHMQQYFSVAEVLFSLQQVLTRKQQQQQQMPLNGNAKVPAMQQKPYAQINNSGGHPRRDFSGSRRPLPKGRVNVPPPPPPPPPSDPIGKKEPDSTEVDAEESKETVADISSASVSPDSQQRDEDPPSSNVNESLQGESSRVKEAQADKQAAVVERSQKVCNHVFGEVKRAQMEHSATEILGRTTTGDHNCIRGKLKTSQETATNKKTPRSIPELVHSMMDYLSGQGRGIFPGEVRPNFFMFHAIDEGKSLSIEEKDTAVQPLCLVSLLADPFVVSGKAIGQVTLEAGSVLKFEQNAAAGNEIAYAVASNRFKRILVFLGLEQQCQEATAPPSKPVLSAKHAQQQSSSSASGGSKQPPSTVSSATQSSSAQSSSWQQASRPGTGVYIPNSSSGSKCDIPISHRGACIQDVR
ncbi:uncharacterized protein LOC112349603 [Selaginella moellendorffii]|uniref:uncharacterized protein LOC112349603 n=1 Tax=Selaginella moellendorffii TaxID=88036 RepID=UPI000D1C3D60|nr:uncharacterized protein LOC112349603 [Selaginella moellendorffii]|eukprot:XP_024540080.1 uncharacterized protein LOC112349603 [Selaginella moellendorffii]